MGDVKGILLNGKELNFPKGNGMYFGSGEMPEGYREQVVSTEDAVVALPLLTPEERAQIVQEVLAELGTPVAGAVDENNVVTLKAALAPGEYTFQLEMDDGSVVLIGTATKEA